MQVKTWQEKMTQRNIKKIKNGKKCAKSVKLMVANWSRSLVEFYIGFIIWEYIENGCYFDRFLMQKAEKILLEKYLFSQACSLQFSIYFCIIITSNDSTKTDLRLVNTGNGSV